MEETDNREMFVNNISGKTILVYDMDGNLKRSFQHKDGTMYDEVYNFYRGNLICHDDLNDNSISISLINVGQSFFIISKQDGSLTKEIQITFKEKKSIVMKHNDVTCGMTYAYTPSTVHPMVPYFENHVLLELSADTVCIML